MQDPVQKSVVFPERVKSCNLYRVTGLYSLRILKESKSRRVKSCNPFETIYSHIAGHKNHKDLNFPVQLLLKTNVNVVVKHSCKRDM